MRDNPPEQFIKYLKEKINDEIMFKEISNYIINMELTNLTLHEIIDELQNENDSLLTRLESFKLNDYNRSGLNRIK